MDSRQWPYEKALEGVKTSCSCAPVVFYLNETPSSDTLSQQISSLQPDLLIAVGSKSLKFAMASDAGLPVVYAMVLNPWPLIQNSTGMVAGVAMNIAPHTYWEAMDNIKPRIKTVGLVYNQSTTQPLAEYAKNLADQRGQKLISRPVKDATTALQAINEMASQIDAFLMLPDTTIFRREIVDNLLFQSFRHNFVLIGLSHKYVKAGALIAYSFNSYAIGQSSGVMVKDVLNGVFQEDIKAFWAPKVELSINLKTAEKIGVSVGQKLVDNAMKVIE